MFITEYLWGSKARVSYLIAAAAFMFLCMLGANELWTLEWRWADISKNMLLTGNYFHPYLEGEVYYDKPLLSYWFTTITSKLLGDVTEFSIRLPTALGGILTVFLTYKLGLQLVNRRVGLMAGWMLVTTYYFIFWSRTSSADMLNVAGIMLALVWYFSQREKPGFFNYLVFFLILALTSLIKGLIGWVVPLVAILPDLLQNSRWQKHLRFSLLFALVIAVIIYLIPFWASFAMNGHDFYESGLYQVYRENILRYFTPFDHQGPWYTYLIFLPVYMLPWAFLFVAALIALPQRWQQLSPNSRWIIWSTFITFLFLTLSGSRRSVYVLPLVPLATLLTADWINNNMAPNKQYKYVAKTAVISFIIFAGIFCILEPWYFTDKGSIRSFGKQLKQVVSQTRPWQQSKVILLDVQGLDFFYLNPGHNYQALELPRNKDSADYTASELLHYWPIILEHRKDTVLITQYAYLARLKPYLANYEILVASPKLENRLFHKDEPGRLIALIPKLK